MTFRPDNRAKDGDGKPLESPCTLSPDQQVYAAWEAAAALRISRRELDRMRAEGEVVSVRIGRGQRKTTRVFLYADLLDALRARRDTAEGHPNAKTKLLSIRAHGGE